MSDADVYLLAAALYEKYPLMGLALATDIAAFADSFLKSRVFVSQESKPE